MSNLSNPVPSQHSNLLVADALSKRWGSRLVLRRVTLAISTGQTWLLRGENGSGKTTLLRCLAGLLRPDAGDVRLSGQSLASCEPSSRRQLGIALHQPLVYLELTTRENLVFAARLYGLASAHVVASKWLERAQLTHAADRPAGQLSQGQRQRLSIARALLHDPPLALFDEPFNALDDAARHWFVHLIRERRQCGTTTLLSTHQGWPHDEPVDQIVELVDGQAICREANSNAATTAYCARAA